MRRGGFSCAYSRGVQPRQTFGAPTKAVFTQAGIVPDILLPCFEPHIAKLHMETTVGSSPTYSKVLLTEEFDEGLMVLRRLLKWDMVDMTYLSMYKTAKGSRRYDGKELVDAPHFDDLPEHVRRDLSEGIRPLIIPRVFRVGRSCV